MIWKHPGVVGGQSSAINTLIRLWIIPKIYHPVLVNEFAEMTKSSLLDKLMGSGYPFHFLPKEHTTPEELTKLPTDLFYSIRGDVTYHRDHNSDPKCVAFQEALSTFYGIELDAPEIFMDVVNARARQTGTSWKSGNRKCYDSRPVYSRKINPLLLMI